jgi:hypothetical protein
MIHQTDSAQTKGKSLLRKCKLHSRESSADVHTKCRFHAVNLNGSSDTTIPALEVSAAGLPLLGPIAKFLSTVAERVRYTTN